MYAYRARHYVGPVLLATFGGLALMLGAIFLGISLTKSAPKWVMVAISLTALAAFMAILFYTIFRLDRARKRSLSTALSALGLTMLDKARKNPDALAIAQPVIALLPMIPKDRGHVAWVASGDAQPLKALEHFYTTGSGKTQQTHIHTVLSWPAPANWPIIALSRLGKMARFGQRITGQKDLDIAASDEAFARSFLSPGVRAALASAPPAETWLTAGQRIFCIFKGPLDGENLAKMHTHAQIVLGAVDRSLWTA